MVLVQELELGLVLEPGQEPELTQVLAEVAQEPELEVLAEVAAAERVPELEPLVAAEPVHSDGCPTLGRTAHATPGFAGSQQYDAAP